VKSRHLILIVERQVADLLQFAKMRLWQGDNQMAALK
jgi:hypothetical protein